MVLALWVTFPAIPIKSMYVYQILCAWVCTHLYIVYHTHMGSGMSLRAWVGSWNASARHQRPGHSRQGVGPDLPPCWHSSQPVINCHKDTGGKPPGQRLHFLNPVSRWFFGQRPVGPGQSAEILGLPVHVKTLRQHWNGEQ